MAAKAIHLKSNNGIPGDAPCGKRGLAPEQLTTILRDVTCKGECAKEVRRRQRAHAVDLRRAALQATDGLPDGFAVSTPTGAPEAIMVVATGTLDMAGAHALEVALSQARDTIAARRRLAEWTQPED